MGNYIVTYHAVIGQCLMITGVDKGECRLSVDDADVTCYFLSELLRRISLHHNQTRGHSHQPQSVKSRVTTSNKQGRINREAWEVLTPPPNWKRSNVPVVLDSH